MKKHYFLLSSALLLTGAAHAQGTELFFSEYAEGAHQSGVSYNGGVSTSTGNERALEVFNPTTSTVNLNPYSVRRYSNGSVSVVDEERLMRTTGANTLTSGSTFVYANGEATLVAIRSVASQYGGTPYNTNGPNHVGVAPTGNVSYFNGDDAVALVRYPSGTAGQGNGVIVDLVGVIGEQPLLASGATGGNWSSTNPADGTTPAIFVSSANQTIIRRPAVSTGVRTNPSPQNVPGSNPPVRAVGGYSIANEWMMYSTAFNGPGGTSNPGGQLYDRLGEHNDYTGPFGTYQTTLGNKLAEFDANISIYPNPAKGTATVQIKNAKVGSIVVLNNLGQRIVGETKGMGQENIKLDISGLKAGLYFVQIISTDGATKIYKELVVQ
jgi:hypothetical protein